MAIDEPPFDFITDVRFLFLNRGALHAARVFIRHRFCPYFFPAVRFCFYAHGPANNTIAAAELTPNFPPFVADKNILIPPAC